MRLTIPKSQGKQPFYDARKSSWGDIFPHEPKNAPHERFQSMHAQREGPTEGKDIRKRHGSVKSDHQSSYAASSKKLKERRKDRIRARNNPLESTSTVIPIFFTNG
jgi:ribosomal protein RSM22 (predicted rRNA methylase)